MSEQSFEMIAKTFQGLEEVLAQELTALGANEIEIGRRMVSFSGDKEMMYKANFCLRTAIRILKPIKHFTAKDADEVYEQIKAIRWEDYLDTDKTFAVDAVVFSEEFRHSKFVSYKVKDAIVDYFREKTGERPGVRVNKPDVLLNIHIAETKCTLSLDSSGESLHRRGYRQEAVEAPLNEVLAAGMILMTGWRGECDLIDPMCGSGTIPIEAALIARNIAPGVFRKEFAFEKWVDFDQELFDTIYNDDSQEREFTHKIYGYDNSPKANEIATHNIKAAGVSKDVVLKLQPFQQFEQPAEKSIIITNPPFSGQKTESMMMDPDILKLFGFGHRPDPEGTFPTITDDDDRDAGHGTLLIRQAPELLFLERCIDWLKPGGRIGIVLPKGILDNRTYINYRRWMLSRCKVDAVVTLHKNTFEPDTGVRTCVLFLSKPLEDDPVPGDYTIFMAQSRRVGKDSKGEPVFALDEKGSATSELDEDLTQIAEAYKTFRDIGTFTESETCFTAERGELDDNLNLNPQHYSPELNATLEKVSKFDDKPDWSVTTIGQLDKNIRIYMGPRWSSRSLVVEDPSDTTNLTPYLTANGALEQRRMTVKWFDMSRATDKQKECVRMLRVQKGDILISRSGTIGKVTYATRILADKYVISDDLVRVRVPDENMRAYLLAFLMSSTAMNLMKLDEFGSVQQHLQPRHIWGLPVPVPDSWEQVSPIIDAGKGMISAMEQTSLADESLRTNGFDSLIE